MWSMYIYICTVQCLCVYIWCVVICAFMDILCCVCVWCMCGVCVSFCEVCVFICVHYMHTYTHMHIAVSDPQLKLPTILSV